jgi:hypothetical protein
VDDPISVFVCCAVLCAAGSFAVLTLKAARILKLKRALALLLGVVLAGMAWCCLWLAASISASV